MHAPEASTWGVIVPVKGGRRAKSRLRVHLGEKSVARLAMALALDTVEAAIGAVGAPHVYVVSAPRDPWSVALSATGASPLPDPGGGLDAASASAASRLATTGYRQVAVLLGDHPCLTPADLGVALRAAAGHRYAVVPDAAGTGTALLTTTAPNRFRSAFGAGSAARHQALGATRLDLDLPGLRLDVDNPHDLAAAIRLGLGPHTMAALGYAADRAGDNRDHQ